MFHQKKEGFVLIEVVGALLILSSVLVLFASYHYQQIRVAHQSKKMMEAVSLACSTLETFFLDGKPDVPKVGWEQFSITAKKTPLKVAFSGVRRDKNVDVRGDQIVVAVSWQDMNGVLRSVTVSTALPDKEDT